MGDLRAEWLARVDRAAFRLVLGTGDELREVAEQAIEIFAELHDDSALALAWRRMAFVERREGRYGASVEPSARAVEFARVAGDAYEEARAIDSLCTGLLYGPVPAEEAADRCRALLSDADGRPATQANILASLAELEAMLGQLRGGARCVRPVARDLRGARSAHAARRADDDRRRARAALRETRWRPRRRRAAGIARPRGQRPRGRARAARSRRR